MKFSSKLIITVIAIALIVAPLFSVGVFFYARAILLERIVDTQLELATHQMDEIDRVLYKAYQDIRLIAEDELLELVFEKGQLPEKESLELINRTVEEDSIMTGPWDALMVVNKGGVVVASLHKDSIGKNIRDYSKTRLAFHPALKGNAYYSDLVLSEKTGRLTVIFSAPIKGDITHEVKGVVIGHFAWPVVEELLDDMPTRSHAHLLNKDGVLIGGRVESGTKKLETSFADHNLVKKSLAGEEIVTGAITTMVKERIKVIAVYVSEDGFLSFRGNNWGLLVEIPVSSALAPIKRMAINLTIIAIIVMIILTWVAYFVGKTLVDPIVDLSKTVKIVGSGDLSARVKVRTNDEIGILGSSFNKMTEDLQKTTVSKDYVDNIIRTMLNTLVVVTPEATIQTVNQSLCDLLGYKKKDLIGQPIGMIFLAVAAAAEEKEEEKLFYKTGIADLIKKGFIANVDKVYLAKDGKRIPVTFSGSVMRDGEGSIQGIVCVASDITERKQAEKIIIDTAETERKRAAELKILNEELRKKTGRIERFQKLTMGREHDIIRMKKEVNELLAKLGQANRYEAPEKVKALKKR